MPASVSRWVEIPQQVVSLDHGDGRFGGGDAVGELEFHSGVDVERRPEPIGFEEFPDPVTVTEGPLGQLPRRLALVHRHRDPRCSHLPGG